jgi:diguanylate cyclase (GGDEF)-like protein/PAS domain S-box-containing protein
MKPIQRFAPLQVILEEIPDAVFIRDLEGNFILVNTAYTTLFSLENECHRPSGWIGRNLRHVYSPALAQRFIEQDQEALKARRTLTHIEDLTLPGKSGSLRRFFLKITCGVFQDTQGQVEGVFGVARNLTEQLQNEALLQEERARAEILAAENARLMNLLANFAEAASAEMKGPITHPDAQHQEITDKLTESFSRRSFLELGRRELDRANRYHRPLSTILLDLDQFRQVNEQHGQNTGDQALRGLTARLQRKVREFDLFARWGDDEFVILLPETDLPGAHKVAERLRLTTSEAPIQTDAGPLQLSISLGIGHASSSTPNLRTLIQQADLGLYLAKQAGRNCVRAAASTAG